MDGVSCPQNHFFSYNTFCFCWFIDISGFVPLFESFFFFFFFAHTHNKVIIKRKTKPSLHPQPKPEGTQTVCDSLLHVAGRKYLIHFPLWTWKGRCPLIWLFHKVLHNLSRKVSFLVWCMPISRKENAAEAVPAGSKPILHFQSQGNGISRVAMKVEAKQHQHLGCSLRATAVWEMREGEGRKKGMPNENVLGTERFVKEVVD